MMEDHDHIDGGHSHADSGHTHSDAGHTHTYTATTDVPGACVSQGCNWHWEYPTKTSSVGKANIQASRANIQASNCNVGKMSSGSKGSETRPINMRVVWIIKAW